jgi:hypothetical protein
MELMNRTDCLASLAETQSAPCPYRDASVNICSASLTSLALDKARLSGYCSTENFDNCVLFLSKALRKK